MRIGIDITPVIYQGTGIGTYTRQLVSSLLKLKTKDHFTLFASTLRGQKTLWQYLQTLKSYDNFSVKVFPFPPLVTETLWNKFHKFPIENLLKNIEVFHAWDWQQPPKKNLKIVTTIHDLTTIKFPKSQHPKTIRVHKARLRHVAKEADVIICDSDSTKSDVIKLLNIDSLRLKTVYLAASPEFASVSSQAISLIQKKYNLTNNYILSVGTQEPRKNLKNTIKAFKLLDNKNLSLVSAGKYGWGKLNLKDQDQLSNVKTLGFVPQSNLPALFAGASVFVYPSLYEGFGLPVLEAMTAGCPVVTSDRGSLKEVAGEAAILINPKNPLEIAAGIKTAIGNSSQLIKLGYKQAKKFSWEKTAKQTLKIYKSQA